MSKLITDHKISHRLRNMGEKRCKNSSCRVDISCRVPWTVTTQASCFFLQACEIFMAFLKGKKKKNPLKIICLLKRKLFPDPVIYSPALGNTALGPRPVSSADSTWHDPLPAGLHHPADWAHTTSCWVQPGASDTLHIIWGCSHRADTSVPSASARGSQGTAMWEVSGGL